MAQGLDTILMENADSYYVHGFSYNDYLSELGPDAQSLVFNISSPLDKAFNNTFYNARRFLMTVSLRPAVADLVCSYHPIWALLSSVLDVACLCCWMLRLQLLLMLRQGSHI